MDVWHGIVATSVLIGIGGGYRWWTWWSVAQLEWRAGDVWWEWQAKSWTKRGWTSVLVIYSGVHAMSIVGLSMVAWIHSDTFFATYGGTLWGPWTAITWTAWVYAVGVWAVVPMVFGVVVLVHSGIAVGRRLWQGGVAARWWLWEVWWQVQEQLDHYYVKRLTQQQRFYVMTREERAAVVAMRGAYQFAHTYLDALVSDPALDPLHERPLVQTARGFVAEHCCDCGRVLSAAENDARLRCCSRCISIRMRRHVAAEQRPRRDTND